MDTFELLPSLAQGELSDTGSPELVAAVFRSRASGTLWLETKETGELRVYFRAGDLSGAAAFSGFKTLAHVLLENDWVDALDIDASRSEAEVSKKRHGEVLVARGLLTPEQLRGALAEQHRANLRTLLQAEKGPYDWRGWEPPPQWAREVTVDPIGVLADALEQERHAARRKRVLSWLGANRVRLSVDWPDLQGRIVIGQMDRRAAALLALPRTLGEFVQASRLPSTRAEALLVALLLAGGVEPQPVASMPAPVAAPAPLGAAHADILEAAPLGAAHADILEPFPEPEPALELLPEPTVEEILPEAGLEPSPDFLPEPEGALALDEPMPPVAAPARALVNEREALDRLDSLSLDDLAPPPPEEPLELDTRPRPREAARPSAPPPARQEVDLESALTPARGADDERARELRRRMVQRGMRNLGHGPGEAREEPGPTAVAETPAAEVDLASLSEDDRRFAIEVRNKVVMMESQTAYARLGVTPTTPTDAIRQAYLQAAKRYHPDRSASPGLASLQPELQRVFAWLKEAWDLISTPEARGRYDVQLKSAGGAAPKPTSKREEAATVLKMGDVLLKKRDFEGALTKLRRAVELDPTGDALAALAWGIVSDPKQPAPAKEEAATLINRALRAPGVTARTYYVAGVLWRTKDPESAVDAFRKALELDPNHPDASLELRLIEQRRGKQAKGGGVLSGLLFGKRKPGS